jgi:hypothetical protein
LNGQFPQQAHQVGALGLHASAQMLAYRPPSRSIEYMYSFILTVARNPEVEIFSEAYTITGFKPLQSHADER